MSSPGSAVEVLTFGRSGVDIYPLQVGVGLEDVETFGKFLGGTTANVVGRRGPPGPAAAIITGVGDDPFGRFVRRELAGSASTTARGRQHRVPHAGDLLRDLPSGRLPAVLLPPAERARPAGHARRPGPRRRPRRRRLSGSRSPASARSRAARRTMPRWRPGQANRTPCSTSTTARCSGRRRRSATEQVQKVLAQVTVAVGNREECEVAVGETDPERAADALLDAGVELAIVKQGPEGRAGEDPDRAGRLPADPDQPLNGLGAGDTFGGSLVPRPAGRADRSRSCC